MRDVAATSGRQGVIRGGRRVLEDDQGEEADHLLALGEVVDEEGVEALVVLHGHPDQEVVAARHDQHLQHLGAAARPSRGSC